MDTWTDGQTESKPIIPSGETELFKVCYQYYDYSVIYKFLITKILVINNFLITKILIINMFLITKILVINKFLNTTINT